MTTPVLIAFNIAMGSFFVNFAWFVGVAAWATGPSRARLIDRQGALSVLSVLAALAVLIGGLVFDVLKAGLFAQ